MLLGEMNKDSNQRIAEKSTDPVFTIEVEGCSRFDVVPGPGYLACDDANEEGITATVVHT